MTLQKQIKLNPQKDYYKISATLPSGKNQKKSILCILREGSSENPFFVGLRKKRL